MSASGDVILIDSDSEHDASHVAKKPKLAGLPQKPSGQIALFTKPFMQDSDSSSGPSRESSPDSVIHEKASSLTAEPAHEINQGSESFLDSLGTTSVVSSDLDEIPPSTLSKAAKEPEADPATAAMLRTIYDTRKFLKIHGPIDFLEEHLPPTATSEDILDLILKLGFIPRNIPPVSEGENLLHLISLLHRAMKRVRELRSRLDHFYSVNHVLDALRSSKKILVITGAGISTSLGIPDFRSSKGFYSRISNLGLTDPQEVFDLEIFRSDPSIFYSIAHMILPPDNIYAPLHKFIKLLQDKGKLLRNYTQNIDNLEANAGIHKEKLVQCHGSFATASCITCHYEVPGSELYDDMRNKEIAYCPKCASRRKKLMNQDSTYVEESYGVMKPNITFFGEDLPRLFHSTIERDLRECDLIISIGTSLKVAPVAHIVDRVSPLVPQILVNRDPLPYCNFDVSLLGYCDDAASFLCNQLGHEWALDHPEYAKIIGPSKDNLEAVEEKEKGVYRIRNKSREAREALKPQSEVPEPDLVILEPTLG